MKIEDIKKIGKRQFLIIMGNKNEVMAKLDELANEEKKGEEIINKELLETVNEIWDSNSLEEKISILEEVGYDVR